MKRVIVSAIAFLSVLGLSNAARATEVGDSRRFGLGFQVGDPTAIIGKAFVGRDNAIDFGLGFWGYGYGRCWDNRDRRYYNCSRGYGRLSLHGDFLWQQEIVRSTVKLDWHIGAGGRIYLWDDDRSGDDDIWLAARMPLGLDLTFNRPDFLELFFEIAPGLFLFPFLDFDLDVAIGVRFYF